MSGLRDAAVALIQDAPEPVVASVIRQLLDAIAPAVARYPLAFGHMLGNTDMLVNGAVELAIVGDPSSEAFHDLERTAADRYVPALVVAGGALNGADDMALLRDRAPLGGRPTAFVCRNYACELPATDVSTLARQLDGAARA